MVGRNNYKKKFYILKIFGSFLVGLGFFLSSLVLFGIEGNLLMSLLFGSLALCLAANSKNSAIKKLANEGYEKTSLLTFIFLVLNEIVLLICLSAFSGASMPAMIIILAMICIILLDLSTLYKCSKQKLIRTNNTEKEDFASIKFDSEKIITIVLAILFITLSILVYLIAKESAENTIKVLSIFFVIVSIIAPIIFYQILDALQEESDKAFLKNIKEKQEANREKMLAERETLKESEKSNISSNETVASSFKQPNFSDTYQNKELSSLSEYYEHFYNYAQKCGVSISKNNAIQILSALSASRAVWLKCSDAGYAEKVANIISSYFTASSEVFSADFNSAGELFTQNDGSGKFVLIQNILKAKNLTNRINVIAFNNVSNQNFEKLFGDFIEFFRASEGEVEVKSVGNVLTSKFVHQPTIQFSWNIWCVFAGKSNQSMPYSAIEYMTEVSLDAQMVSNHNAIAKPSELPVLMNINDITRDTLNKNYISLNVWKKIDRVEEYLNKSVKFKLTNPVIRQMESYASVIIEFGADTNEVIDNLLSLYVLPQLAIYSKEQIDQEGNSFYSLVDGLFGMENLSLTKKLFNEMNFN